MKNDAVAFFCGETFCVFFFLVLFVLCVSLVKSLNPEGEMGLSEKGKGGGGWENGGGGGRGEVARRRRGGVREESRQGRGAYGCMGGGERGVWGVQSDRGQTPTENINTDRSVSWGEGWRWRWERKEGCVCVGSMHADFQDMAAAANTIAPHKAAALSGVPSIIVRQGELTFQMRVRGGGGGWWWCRLLRACYSIDTLGKLGDTQGMGGG